MTKSMFAVSAAIGTLLITGWPTPSEAVSKVVVKTNSKTGAVEVTATGVGANPRWGVADGATDQVFADQGTCVLSGTLIKCHLGAVGTLAEKTPPPTCALCVGDDSGPDVCVPYIKKCPVGARVGDASFQPGDPRLTGGGGAIPCASQTGNDVYFTGCNVHVRDGSGSTAGSVNGLGNLIVGYNESDGDAKTGSHNLIIGEQHSYLSYGGLVAGLDNATTAPNASVSGGQSNEARSAVSSISGGLCNRTGPGTNKSCSGLPGASSVAGGINNLAQGNQSSICGGSGNTATGSLSTISGGASALADGGLSTVIGPVPSLTITGP